MSAATDRVLAVLDAGLQTSTEQGYGTDRDPSACARCLYHAPESGDLCAGCRAFLLGDTDNDPAGRSVMGWTVTPHRYIRGTTSTFVVFDEIHRTTLDWEAAAERITHTATEVARALGVAFNEAAEALTRAFNSMSPDTIDALRRSVESISSDTTPDPNMLRHGFAATCPRHGQTKGGTCMKCARRP